MKKIISAGLFFFTAIIYISCVSQSENLYIPVPDSSYFVINRTIGIDIDSIIDFKNTGTNAEWLYAFLEGGIEAVELKDQYNDKYVFISVNKDENFPILEKWAENYSEIRDFPMLAAARIEKKMILSSSLYPDDEYGLFFERLVKNAFTSLYPGTVKEDISWIKLKSDNENSNNNLNEIYMFFVLITIDKQVLQNQITNMITHVLTSVSPTSAQRASINRLRQTFFEGF